MVLRRRWRRRCGEADRQPCPRRLPDFRGSRTDLDWKAGTTWGALPLSYSFEPGAAARPPPRQPSPPARRRRCPPSPSGPRRPRRRRLLALRSPSHGSRCPSHLPLCRDSLPLLHLAATRASSRANSPAPPTAKKNYTSSLRPQGPGKDVCRLVERAQTTRAVPA